MEATTNKLHLLKSIMNVVLEWSMEYLAYFEQDIANMDFLHSEKAIAATTLALARWSSANLTLLKIGAVQSFTVAPNVEWSVVCSGLLLFLDQKFTVQ